MILDEPTASLDEANKAVVRTIINDARRKGTAIIAIFHDEKDRRRVATRQVAVAPLIPDEAPERRPASHAV